MIEKQPGNPTINKLRALHLFENDFNLLLGILWGKRLLLNGEKHQVINQAQYGSRNNKSTHNALIFKHLQWPFVKIGLEAQIVDQPKYPYYLRRTVPPISEQL